MTDMESLDRAVKEAWKDLSEVFRTAPYDMPLRFEKRRVFEAAVSAKARAEERERYKVVTRVEVVDHRRDPARCYSAWESEVEPAFQDGGRTLKLFVRARSSEEAGNG